MAGTDLRRADLKGENMRGADLRGKSLFGADLSGSDLSGASMVGADLREADMTDADLTGVNFRSADLLGAILRGVKLNVTCGNGREIKSAQFDEWPITWITDPDDGPILQIGRQKHSIEKWEKADKRWLAKMGPKANEWADKYLDLVCQLVRASPANFK